jgi:hypothetical protein
MTTRIAVTALFLCLVGGLSAVPLHALAAIWPELPPEAWTQTARPDSGGRDAIVLSEEGSVEDRGGTFRYSVTRRLRILTENGRDAGKIEIDYLKGRSKLVEIAARSVRQDGTSTELTPDQILTTTILKAGGLEFNRATAIVPGIEPGCIVEYRYRQDGKYDGFWAWPWSFQGDYYTLESRFHWKAQDLPVARAQWASRNTPRFAIETACTPNCGDAKEVTFVARAIPGMREESWAPPLRDSGGGVVTFYTLPNVSSIQFWSAWKRLFDLVATEFGKKMGTFANVVDDARAKAPDSTAALDEVCRWLRSNVRSNAELSWEQLQAPPRERDYWAANSSLADMIKKREGTPFEINLAFATAAQRLGFDACVCLVRDRREGVFDYDVIGALPTEPVTAVRPKGSSHWKYYEPASRFAIPGNVPWFLRGGPGLVAGPGDNLTLTIDPEDGVPAATRWDLDLALDGAGNLSGKLNGTLAGEEARSYRAKLYVEDPARSGEVIADELSPKDAPDLKLARVSLDGSPDSALVITGTLRYPLAAVAAGEVSTLPVEKIAPWRFEGKFDSPKRTQPIFFRYPRREVLTVDLHLPANSKIEELPAPGSFKCTLGSWETHWSRIADGVRYERLVDIRYGERDARDFGEVQTFFKGLAETDHDLLLISAQ